MTISTDLLCLHAFDCSGKRLVFLEYVMKFASG